MNTQTRGYIAILGALSIWTSWMLLTKYSSHSGLESMKLTALRFLVAGGVLLPLAIKKLGRNLLQAKLIVLSVLMGAPYMYLVATGIKFSYAAHAATFINATMVIVSILLSRLFFSKSISLQLTFAVGLMVAGLFQLGGVTGLHFGDALFVIAGGLWACYSVLIQYWKIKSLDAVLAVNFWALIGFALPYTLLNNNWLFETHMKDLIIHGSFQGIATSILAHIFFATSVNHLGAARVSLFVPLVPVITAFAGTFLLSESLDPVQWAGVGLVTLGIFISKINFKNLLGNRNLLSRKQHTATCKS